MTNDRTPDRTHDDAQERLDAEEVELFMSVQDWRPRHGDTQVLIDRATEIAGNAHFYCSDLQLALRELRGQDPEFGRYVPPTPEPEPVHKTDNGIIEVPTNTGAKLTVDPEVRRELNHLTLAELARRARVDRAAALSETRRKQIRASEI